jgi:SAM-dependent methyltransferase
MSEAQSTLTDANSTFWTELCGTTLARSIGVTDSSPASLARFDRWYFDFYPYLDEQIGFDSVAGQRVLEVGLGYGTVAQRLAAAGAVYQGLDISPGPVAMVNHRLRQAGLAGGARQGDVLACPFPDQSFDRVVAIGCYHHTGDLGRAIAETRRVLKPGGRATIMVYSAYSYRRWVRWFAPTLSYFIWDKLGAGEWRRASAAERAAYDADSSGAAAPETVFISASHMRRLASDWRKVEIHRRNIGAEFPLGLIPRRYLLPTLGPLVGLDLYCQLDR